MDFSYSDEQAAMQDTLLRYIGREYGFERRRELARSPLGYSAQGWSQWADLGLLSQPFPQQHGGLGGNAIDIMLVMEQIGRGLLLEPYLSSVVMGGGLIRDAAGKAQKSNLLPRIGAGEIKLALAIYEAGSRYDLSRVDCVAAVHGAGWRLSGQKAVVLDGPSADYFVVSARSDAAAAPAGVSLFLVAREAPGVTLFCYPTQSGGRAADVRFDTVALDPDALIGAAGRGLALMERAVDRGVAALCAEAVGIMVALNEATLNYLKSRKQFGVSIGNFQALQHRMVDMFIAAEQSRSMAVNAAVYADSEDAAQRRRAVSGAKAYIGQAARLVGQEAVQMHGAMGVVDDFIVSHYFKRLTMIELSLGDADFHLGRFSALLDAAEVFR
jgi:alkylation response protein AidB-like acyl-CoA dehydrogenase